MTATGIVLTDEFTEALDQLERGENLFLTGKAGTGKSTLVRKFLADTDRTTVVIAPTGIAALNVEGYTIHRLFSFGPGTTVEHVMSNAYYPRRFSKTLRSLDTLVVDEASMLRADLFDCLATALERFGPRPGEPFGGVQLVLVGDLFQLPPVVLDAERDYFTTRYDTPYFFSADSYDPAAFPVVHLTQVFRQMGDSHLVDILNGVREGRLLDQSRDDLNLRAIAGFTPPLDEMWLTLTTTNRIAAARNRQMLAQLKAPEHISQATSSGDLDGFDPPTDEALRFKVGAQIMMLSNDTTDRWVNGTLARIQAHRTEGGVTVVTVDLPDQTTVDVRPHTWEVTRPVVQAGNLRHEVTGTYTQLPFRLAWAVTIHKSQGQTLERVVVDLSGGTFADGQLYVALSRCTSMEGLVLYREVLPKDLKVDQRIRRFLTSATVRSRPTGRVYIGMCTVGDVGRAWRPRPVEIAVITEDGTELTSLINPERDLGEARTDFAITASDVLLAPTLVEAWAALAPHLAGRVPVAVGVDEVLGLIDFELKRHESVVALPLGVDLAPLVTRQDEGRLTAPSALARARAAQEIAERTPLLPVDEAEAFPSSSGQTGYLLPRGRTPVVFAVGTGTIDAGGTDASSLDALGAKLVAHLRDRAQRAASDGPSRATLQAIESLTGSALLPELDKSEGGTVLQAGARVCFTGSAFDGHGEEISRDALKTIAERHGLLPVDTVTKSRCEVLVSAESGSQSTKARKAIQYAKPIITVDEFLAWSQGGALPAPASAATSTNVVILAVPTPSAPPLVPVSTTRAAPPSPNPVAARSSAQETVRAAPNLFERIRERLRS